jgi:tetratricopeptide (TPR) repeat protein
MSAPQTAAERFASDFQTGYSELPASRRFTPEQLEVIYALAYSHARQQQWSQALPIFAFLSQYGPTRRHYLAGLAQSLQMLKRLEEAVLIYSLMLVLFPDQLEPSIHVAQCQLAQGDRDSAVATLSQLDSALEDDAPLKQRTRALLEQLQKPQSASSPASARMPIDAS